MTLSGNYKCKSIAVTCMADTEAEYSRAGFCVHTLVCSVGSLNKICSPTSMRFLFFFFSFFFFPKVYSAPFNNSHTLKNYKFDREKEAEMLKCVSI